VKGTTNYAVGSSDESIIPIAHFARDQKGKNFKIEYYGGTGNTDPSAIKLANERADKIRAVLLANGATEDQLIEIEPDSEVIGTDSDGGVNEVDRGRERVSVMAIVIGEACGGGANSLQD
jgi:hypothetical protein